MRNGETKLRAFVALTLDAAAKDRVLRLMDRLRRELHGVRWVRPEGIHLTVRFLGWSAPSALDQLETDLARAALACPAAEGRVGPLGMFPERGAPRVLWLGLTCPPRVFDLQRACEEAAVRAGFEAEERAFRPHVTLGRWAERERRPSLPEESLGVTALDALVLFRSELRRDGAVYTPLRTFALGGS